MMSFSSNHGDWKLERKVKTLLYFKKCLVFFPFYFTENTADIHVTVKFVQDTSKFWYKPDISREQGISIDMYSGISIHRKASCEVSIFNSYLISKRNIQPRRATDNPS